MTANSSNWLSMALFRLTKPFALLLAVAAIMLQEWKLLPHVPSHGLDPSWQFAMHQALVQGLQIGKDIVFTFGPYSFLYTHIYHPETDVLATATSTYLVLSYCVPLALLLRSASYLSLLGIALVFTFFLKLSDPFLLTYPILVGFVIYQMNNDGWRGTTKESALLTVLFLPFGLLPLVKGTMLIQCLAVTSLTIILFVWNKHWRHAATVALSPAIALLLFWVISGQELLGLFSYLLNIAPIISGYTDAMSIAGPFVELMLYGTGAALTLIAAMCIPATHRSTKLYLMLSLGLSLLLVLKAAFVRHDGHALIASCTLLLITLYLSLISRSPWVTASILVAVTTLIVTDANYSRTSTKDLLTHASDKFVNWQNGWKYRFENPGSLDDRYFKRLVELSSSEPILRLEGTADIYSYNQSALLSSGATWSPRPIFQSYSAYTPALAELNKAHLLSENAPNNILFKMQPIDGRLPALEDGLSWPAIMNNYALSAEDRGYLYLKRKPDLPLEPRSTIISSKYHALGEQIAVPNQDAMVFVKVETKLSLKGKLMNALFKAPPLQFKAVLSDGRELSYRYVSGMGAAGFLLSPLIENTQEFGYTFSAPHLLKGKRVKSFSLSPSSGTGFWQDEVLVTFSSLELTQTVNPGSNLSVPQKPTALSANTKLVQSEQCEGYIEQLNGQPLSGRLLVEGLLSANGWQAISKPQPKLADKTILILSDGSNHHWLMDTQANPRPDVARHFGKPELERSGFDMTADTSGLAGPYFVKLGYVQQGQLFLCPQFNIPIVIKAGQP